MNACKRFFALILSLCMVLSFVPVSAFAAETDGEAVTSSEQTLENQDVFVLGSDNTQGEVKVDHAEGVAHVESEVNENVAGLTTDAYVAYDIALYTDDAGTQPYEGDAMISVSIPLTSDLADAQKLQGFAVSESGEMTYIDSVTVDPVLNTATFEVSPSATVGVMSMADDENGDELTVYVGQTKTETISGFGYTNGDVEIEDNSKVTVDVKDTSTTDVTIGEPVTSITPGKYVIYTYLGAYVVNQVDGSGIDLSTSETVWNVEVADSTAGTYYITDGNNNYLTVGNQTAGLDTNPTAVKLVYGTSTDTPGQSGFFIQDANGSYNLNNSGGTESAIGKSGANGSYSRWQFKPYSETVEYSTEVTFTGVEVGKTSVTVGDTQYNVNVIEDRVDVTLYPGEVKEYIDNTGNYQGSYTGEGLDESVATVEVNGATENHAAALSAPITDASQFDGTKQYLIVCNRPAGIGGTAAESNYSVLTNEPNGTGLAMNGPMSADSAELWTITAVNGGYTIKQGDEYLTVGYTTAGMTSTETVLTLGHSTSSDSYKTGWRISIGNNYLSDYQGANNHNAHGWNDAGDQGNYWTIYEVTPAHTASTTTVTITGVDEGTTSVRVGYTRYNITVEVDEVGVTLLPGEVKEYVDNTGNHVNNVDEADNFDQVAKLEVSGTDGSVTYSQGEEVTSLAGLTAGKYLIMSVSANRYLTNVSSDSRLQFGDAIDASSIWTITPSDNGYYVQDSAGNYLYVGSETAGVGNVNEIVLDRDTNWRIKQYGTETYLNDHSNGHTVAGGWPNASDRTDDVLRWKIYKLVEDIEPASTTVTITGVAEGTTSVRVGGTRYNITVKLDEIDVTLNIGEEKSYTDNSGNHANNVVKADNFDQVAELEVTGNITSYDVATTNATELKDGSQYIIVSTSHNNMALTTNVGGNNWGTETRALAAYDQTATDVNVWTLEAVTGGYKIKTSSGYLGVATNTASISDTGDVFTITKQSDGTWQISDGTYYLQVMGSNYWQSYNSVGGWDSDPTNFTLYEATPVSGTTTVTITGVAKGETSVVVGNTRYNITVTAGEVVDVDLKVGETKDFVIDGVVYTTDDATYPNSSIATLDRVEGVIPKELRQITSLDQIVSGKSYLISNLSADGGSGSKADQMLTSTPLTSTTLTLSGTASVDGTANLWTFTANDDGTYQIHQGNNYLNVVNDSVTTSTTSQNLTVAYSTTAATDSAASKTGWSIGYQDGDTTYYLNNYDQLGTKAGEWNQLDNGSLWNIYEIVDLTDEQYTTVTFTGVAPGTTTAQVGRVTYNIKVSKDIKDITVHIGETVVVSQDGVTSNGSNAGLDSAAIADVSWVAMPVGLDVGKLLNADGSEAGTRTLESLEYTFTLNDDGTYCIVDSTGTRYLNVRGIPQSDENVGAILIMNADVSVNIMGMDTQSNRKYLCIYRSGSYVMQWSSGKTAVSEDPEGCAFYIYEKVTDPAESSTEIQGYKRITNLDDIQNGEGYLVAFQAEGANYFCVAYVNDSVGDKYNNTARIAEPGYADVTITGVTVGTTQVNVDGAIYNITVIPNEEEFSLDVGEEAVYEPAVAVTDEEIEAFNNAHGQIVTVEKTDEGMLKFTGVAVGLVNDARLGGTDYTILVKTESVDVLSGMGQAAGKSVTQLLLTECVDDYDLNVPDGFTAEWTSGDTNVLTINENGTITAQNAGTTTVTVEIKDAAGNLVDIKVIPVTVCTGVADTGRWVNIYNEKTVATEPYVYMSCEHSSDDCTSLYPLENEKRIYFPEGMHMYGCWHEQSDKEILIFTAKPEDGYALTGMGATNSAGDYMPVRNDTGDSYLTHTGCTYFQDGNCAAATAGNNAQNAIHDWLIKSGYQAGIMTLEEVHMVVNNMVRDGMDGAHLFSRGSNDGSSYNSTLTFIADKLPEVNKVVQGVQDATLIKEGGWTEYKDGNYAKVGEYIFYQITVTQELPQVWQAANANLGALVYTNAMLYDQLPDAYFYTKDLDNLDGKWDAAIPDEYITSEQSVLDQLNSEWTAEEKAAGSRAFTFNVAYKIKDEDANQDIVNKVALSTTYHSSYSSGNISSSGSAEASLKVVGESLGDVVLDFGLPIMIPSLTMGHMAHRFDQDASNNAVNGCKYGTVAIVQTEGADTLGLNDDRWTITYTPHTVFTGYDVVYLMDSTGKLMNYFRVYPASTVYYEESFAEFGNAVSDQHGWTGHASAITGNAQLMFISNDGTFHTISNFGYTNKYAGETGKSNGTEAVSTKSGDTATFEFTGTGFDIYANCDTATSVMAVLVYKVDVDEQLTKFYQVVTANKGKENAVEVPDAADSLPLVSVTDLEHGHYKVVIRHTKPLNDSTAQIRLDGYRVYNTMLDGDQFYPVDEQNVTFTELRDEALSSVTGFTPDTTVDQIYSESENTTVMYLTSEDDAANLLEYGPKNEIWMSSENALAFTLKDDVAYAHIGLKAPSGATSVTITTQIGGVTSEATYDITTATDMFYDIPAVTVGDASSISGATVTLQVNSGMLSVTKLKTTPAANSTSEANISPLNVMSEVQLASVLDVIFDRKPTPITSNVTRIYGDNRFETAFKVADELKTVLGVEKFENIIVASGTSFADALSGSYLATVKNAPILLSYDDTYDQMVRDYIAENLAENGTVYILGGEAAVAASMDDALTASGVSVKRLAGANRFDTNLAILAEAGVENEEILVCTGTNFADSLSASATGKPILLVYNESGKLTEEQAKYLAQLDGCTFTVIGGEAAVSADLENAVAAYGTTKRIAGENRFQTSVAIAETYMSNPEAVVLAYAGNYPDGLCGGVLAHAMQAPLVLTMTGYESDACAYVNAVKAKTGVILGGSGLISDNSIVNIFNLTDALEIIVK